MNYKHFHKAADIIDDVIFDKSIIHYEYGQDMYVDNSDQVALDIIGKLEEHDITLADRELLDMYAQMKATLEYIRSGASDNCEKDAAHILRKVSKYEAS